MATQMWQEILEQPETLERCIAANRDTLHQLAGELQGKEIHSILIAGRGTSDQAGLYAKYVLEQTVGIPVAFAAPSVLTVYKRSLHLENTLVIGISQSGKAADVMEIMYNATRCGAVTVGITNEPDSPLAKEIQWPLLCHVGPERSVAATKTFTAQIYLLAHLAAFWGKDTALEFALAGVPDLMRQTALQGDAIARKAERFRFMDECFVLGRGVHYAMAMETAIKIQETCYVRARAYATSDFHHGPFAMLDKNMPVFVLAPISPTLPDLREMLDKMAPTGAESILISNVPDLLENRVCAFPIPVCENDAVSAFATIMTAQMFACQLSLIKGLNPDMPRGLNKVTITR